MPENPVLLHPVRQMKLSEITFDGDNPNVMRPDQMEALKENIRRYGFTSPVVVDASGVVADGEHRVQAARELGMQEVPVVMLSTIGEKDRKTIRQVMNKLRGSHDIMKDIAEYQRIISMEGGSIEELAKMLGQPPIEIEALIGLSEIPIKEKDVTNVSSEHSCPKCGYRW